MASGDQLRSSDRRRRAPRRVNPGHMGRPRLFRNLADLSADLADLSADLADAAQTVLSPNDEVRRIFVVPPQEFPSWAKYRYGPGHALIFTDAGVIHVQTAARGQPCLLYTSDAADERSSVDLGGRRIIKKKTSKYTTSNSTASKIETHHDDVNLWQKEQKQMDHQILDQKHRY